MGIMDIVKKAATGATDEENRKNREKMREIFDGAVASFCIAKRKTTRMACLSR